MEEPLTVEELCRAKFASGRRKGDELWEEINRALRPSPGTVCPTCHETTPTKAALHMREYRKGKR